MAVLFLGLSACSIINKDDYQLATNTMGQDGASCVFIQGSGGGGGGVIPPVPITGAYGQGSLAAAHSENPNANLHCGVDGADVQGK